MFDKHKNYLKKFLELHFPEKLWVITHLFKAKKVFEISNKVLKITKEYQKDPDLDGDHSGGMVDAFRHCLWMASITSKYNEKVARSLGKTYEKGNKIDYKKKILEEKYLPDLVSSKMDLINNEKGISIGKKYKNKTPEDLAPIIKQKVLEGYCWKIKKDKNKNFLDIYNQIIPEEKWKGKWETPKTLVPTDFFV